MIDLSIIIVNWNSADYLRQCLSSVHRETEEINYEVIVVDNASGDGCESMLQKEFPDTRFIAAPQNLGFSRANNLGYEYAGGEVLLFLNPDTEIISGALLGMLAYLRTNPAAGAAGARLLNSDGSLQTSCIQAFPTIVNQVLDLEILRRWFPTWKLWGIQPLFTSHRLGAEVDTISGACFMIKRSVFEKVGRFSEQYFMYADDLDLSYKIRQAGYSIVWLSHCEVVHHGGKSSSQQSDCFADVLQRQSLDQFFRKTRGRSYSGSYRGAMMVSALVRLVVALCLMPFAGHVFEGRKTGPVLRKWFSILCWSLGLNPGRA
jgi:N-acetylglucosaminyl-diphospho-decaprenol L-rhamnosyltransferase